MFTYEIEIMFILDFFSVSLITLRKAEQRLHFDKLGV